MSDWREGWQEQKKKLEKLDVNTSIFNWGLSAKCDVFSKALKTLKDAQAKGKYGHNDPKMVSLRADLLMACNELGPTCVAYSNMLKYQEQQATNSNQVLACRDAEGFLLTLTAASNRARGLTV